MAHRHRRGKPAKGFTLLELGVVLGVTAILAAAVLPDFIESARANMAEKAAQDVYVLQDLARWYFTRTLQEFPPSTRGRWPGQANPASCTLTTDGLDLLKQQGFLSQSAAPKNPWGQPYVLSVDTPPPSGGGMPAGCLFQIATDVPKEVRNAFKIVVPLGHCNGEDEGATTVRCKGNPSSSEFARCCSFIAKPGVGANPCANGNPVLVGSVLTCP